MTEPTPRLPRVRACGATARSGGASGGYREAYRPETTRRYRANTRPRSIGIVALAGKPGAGVPVFENIAVAPIRQRVSSMARRLLRSGAELAMKNVELQITGSKKIQETRHPHAFDGMRRLMAAVLEEGVVAVRSEGRSSIQARRWILSDDRTWLFSFESLCEALGIDPQEVRRSLLHRSNASGQESARE